MKKLLRYIFVTLLLTASSFSVSHADGVVEKAEKGEDSKLVESTEQVENTATEATDTTGATDVATEEPVDPLSFTFTSGIFSAYMDRGQALFDGNSMQNSFNVNYATEESGDIWFNLWSHYPGSSKSGESETQPDFIEVDYSLGYTYNVDDWTFTTGISYYSLPRRNLPQLDYVLLYEFGEVVSSISYDAFITPTVTYFQDFSYFYTQYYSLNLAHTWELEADKTPVALTAYVDFGFASNSDTVIYKNNGLEQITYGVSGDITLGSFNLVPSINYTQKVDEYTINQLWMGMNLSYAF